MLLKIKIDPAALSASTASLAYVLSSHNRFERIWKLFGMLVLFKGNSDGKKLFEVINQLPPSTKKIWKDLLITVRQKASITPYRFLYVDSEWAGFKDIEDISALKSLAEYADLICMENEHAELAGLDKDGVKLIAGTDTEVCLLSCIDMCSSISHIEELSRDDIETGTKTEEVWQVYFRRLTEHSRRIIVIDRYLLKNHFYKRDGFTYVKKESPLNKLLLKIDECGSQSNLEIYCSSYGKYEEDELSDYFDTIRSKLCRGGLRSIRFFFMADDIEFGRIFHDRRICFDATACVLGSGLEVLKGKNVERDCSFNLKIRAPRLKDRMKQAMRLSNDVFYKKGRDF